MLLSNMDFLATASGGVARLRELILTLAVQGKLMPQDSADESASELLKKIRAEKDRLIAEGKIKRDKPLAAIPEEEKPFELPVGWARVRLGSVLSLEYGSSLPEKERLPGSIPVYGSNGIVGSHTSALVNEPSLIVGRKGSVGAINISLVPFWPIDTSYFVTPPKGIELLFAFHLLRSLGLAKHDKATAIPGINRNDVYAEIVGLPPLAEQSRIVTRVEELMRLCDALEAKGRLEATQHAQLVSTLLGTLTASSTPEELADHWQRVAQHFDLLLDRPEAIDALEQTLLQLAVSGLLVPQDPTDEPASELLKTIRAEKGKLIAEGKIKRDKPLLPIAEKEQPFALPQGWNWVRLGEIVLVSSGVTLGRKTVIPSPISLPYLRVANVQRWHLNLTSMKELVIDTSELDRFQLVKGDLLITEGGDWDKVGRTAIWRDELPTCVHQNHVFKVRGTSDQWNPVWAEMYLNSAIARTYFALSAKQTTNLASINMTQLKDCTFPLPPLAEQSRIVTRVTELRRLCADLRQRLSAAQTTQSHLAQALAESVTSI